jgi:alanyl-tRNA synthetase
VKRFLPNIKIDLKDIDTKIAVKKSEVEVPKKKKMPEIANLPDTQKLYYENEKLFETEAKVLKVGENYVVLDKTIFYPRGGGAEPDYGEIDGNKVNDVEPIGNIIVHFIDSPKLKEGQKVKIKIDKKRRLAIMRHHTATHILTGSTRKILGNHIWQAGTKKDEGKAHLDITHYEPLTYEQLQAIQNLANQIISKSIKTGKSVMPRDVAEREYGFRLYQGGAVPGKNLRIVSINDFDVEACGGLHLDNVADAEEILIFNTKKIQDGVIRIEFVAGRELVKKMKREISEKTKKEGEDLEKKFKSIEERKKKIKEVKKEGKFLCGINYVDTDDMKELEIIGKGSVEKKPTECSILIGKGIVYGIAGEKSKIDIENKVKNIAKEMGGSAGGSKKEFKGGGSLKEKSKDIYKKFK